MVDDQLWDLDSGKKYDFISNFWEGYTIKTERELMDMIIASFEKRDEILLDCELYYGEFSYKNYIVLNDLLTTIQKWDLLFSLCLFYGATKRFIIRYVNKTGESNIWFETDDLSYKHELQKQVSNLELVSLHLKFESLGGVMKSKVGLQI